MQRRTLCDYFCQYTPEAKKQRLVVATQALNRNVWRQFQLAWTDLVPINYLLIESLQKFYHYL